MKRFGIPVLAVLLTIFPFGSRQTQTTFAEVAKEHRAVTPKKNVDKWWTDRHAKHVAQMNEGNVDLLMIGDSITHLWENTEGTIFKSYAHGAKVWEKYYSSRRVMNLGFAGDRTYSVLWRLDNLPLDKISPKAAVLMIGTNNITRQETTPRQTAEGIQAIVKKLGSTYPDMKILVLHVFPREKDPKNARRNRVRELNSYLPELIGKEKNVTLLDISDKFLDEKGLLSNSIMPDYLHPNAKGYEIWAKAMEPTLKKLLGESADTAAKSLMKRARFLLLDSRIIESTENAELTVGVVQKDKNNPLFGEDKPWEPRFDNPYCSIIYDEEEKLYKCWYSIFIRSGPRGGSPGEGLAPEKRAWVNWREGNRKCGVCYATSKDGIHWEKPELGLIDFNGSKKNNIVIEYDHGVAVMKDLHETDPNKRYKAIHPRRNSAVWFSSDGINWGKKLNAGYIADGDTNQAIWWDPDIGKYVLITRQWNKTTKTIDRYSGGHRTKVRSVSSDFLNWSKPKLVIEGLDLRMQIHDMPVVPHAGVYLGMVGLFDVGASKQWCELAWSPDSIEWHRIQPGKPLIPNGPVMGDYDWGCIFASRPIVRKDEILIYYGANDGRFMAWRSGYFALARLRPDGFAGYEQILGGSNKTGSVTTKTVSVVGNSLCVSADVAPSGFVKVTLFDKDNKKLAQGKLVTKTVSDAKIEWKDGFSFKKLKGKKIKLKFELRESKLFSFSFKQ